MLGFRGKFEAFILNYKRSITLMHNCCDEIRTSGFEMKFTKLVHLLRQHYGKSHIKVWSIHELFMKFNEVGIA